MAVKSPFILVIPCFGSLLGCVHFAPGTEGLPPAQLAVIDTRRLRSASDNRMFYSIIEIDGVELKRGRWYVAAGRHEVVFKVPFLTPARGTLAAEAGEVYRARYRRASSMHAVEFDDVEAAASVEPPCGLAVRHVSSWTSRVSVGDKTVERTQILGRRRDDNTLRMSPENFETTVATVPLTQGQRAALLEWADRSGEIVLASDNEYGTTNRYSPSFSFAYAGREKRIVYESSALPQELKRVISEFEGIIEAIGK